MIAKSNIFLVVFVFIVLVVNTFLLLKTNGNTQETEFVDGSLSRLMAQLEQKKPNSNNLRVLSVLGTRPEGIKMAPIIRRLQNYSSKLDNYVCNTGQHREMLKPLLDMFEITPYVDLGMMNPGATLSDMTAVSTLLLGKVMESVRPHLVIVQGDTTTAMVAGMAAFYRGIPVAHVEAGLRTHRLYSPFPEEENRRVLGTLCSLCYAPTSTAASNLVKEGVPSANILVTGNTAIDNLLWMKEQQKRLNMPKDSMDSPVILITAHRRENWGEPMKRIATAVQEVALKRPNVKLVFPLHRNPIVRDSVVPMLGHLDNVELTEPLDYSEMVKRMAEATIILTDSGGIQEEASGLSVPVLVLRSDTERTESIQAKVAKLVGTKTKTIVEETLRLIDDSNAYNSMSRQVFPYGSGNAAQLIVDDILKHRNRLLNFSSLVKPNHFNLDEHAWNHPESAIETKYKRKSTTNMSVILNIYKRNHLKEQIQAMKQQTLPPDQIYVFQNENHTNVRDIVGEEPNVHLIQSIDTNFKFHGRFVIPLLLDSEYVAFFDDDVIPGPRWLENALNVSETRNALVGCNGRIIKEIGVNNVYRWQVMVDAGSKMVSEQDTEVDFVGHCWIFKRKWIHLFWRDMPISWQSGEDISFSALLHIYGRIPAYVPKMPLEDKSLWGDLKTKYGFDKAASSRITPNIIREEIAQYYINRGWRTLREVSFKG